MPASEIIVSGCEFVVVSRTSCPSAKTVTCLTLPAPAVNIAAAASPAQIVILLLLNVFRIFSKTFIQFLPINETGTTRRPSPQADA